MNEQFSDLLVVYYVQLYEKKIEGLITGHTDSNFTYIWLNYDEVIRLPTTHMGATAQVSDTVTSLG